MKSAAALESAWLGVLPVFLGSMLSERDRAR